MTPHMQRIIGLDPGLRTTGWGVIEARGNSLSYIAHGTVKSTSTDILATRLQDLMSGLEAALKTYAPTEAAVEETFVNKNPVATLKLGMARGVVLVTPARFGLPVFEYTANQVKKAVVGAGHADKTQVAHMVQRLLPTAGEVTADAADALAIAICHASFSQTRHKWGLVG